MKVDVTKQETILKKCRQLREIGFFKMKQIQETNCLKSRNKVGTLALTFDKKLF